jgi:hypothetical protein
VILIVLIRRQSRLIVLSIVLLIYEFDKSIECIELLWLYIVGYICLLTGKSMRGSILDDSKRSSIQYWLYFRLSE